MTFATIVRRASLALVSSLPLSVLAATTTSADAMAKGAQNIDAGYLLQLLVGMIVVLAGIASLVWLLRRVQGLPSSRSRLMKVITGVAVGNRERVVLMQVGETQILVGVAPGCVAALHVFDSPVVDTENPDDSANANALSSLMARLSTRGNRP